MKLPRPQRLIARTITFAGLCLGPAVLALGTSAHAAVIVSSGLTRINDSEAQMTAVDDNVTVSAYTAGGATRISASNNHWVRVDDGTNAADLATITASRTANLYGEFTVTPDDGMQLDLTSLDIGMQIARGTSEETFIVHLRSSLDGYTNDIDTASMVGGGATAIVDGSGSFDLSGVQNLTGATTFRMYMVTDVTDKNGAQYVRIMPDVVLHGTVVPEPGSIALAGLGALCVLMRRRAAA